MTADDLNEIEEIRREAMRRGIVLPEARRAAPTIGCFGHKLPSSFVWFCRHYPRQSGFPNGFWYPPMGLLSPFGQPSDLKRRNEQVRQSEPEWPDHWISFWHGNDGDYCFSYDKDGHAWVVYWDYNAGMNADEFQAIQFEDSYKYANFGDWFANK